ncbi:MAG: hypothetical protein GY950_10535 [bacterium]|nr:hypothetical protein [bacterium]
MYFRYPAGIIMPFDDDCPTGWTRVGDFDELLLRGNSSYSGVEAGYSTHTHTFDPASTKSAIGQNHQSDRGVDFIGNSNQHYHYIDIASTTSGAGDHMPEYINVIFCKKD